MRSSTSLPLLVPTQLCTHCIPEKKKWTSIISTNNANKMINTPKFNPKEGHRIVSAKIGINKTQQLIERTDIERGFSC